MSWKSIDFDSDRQIFESPLRQRLTVEVYGSVYLGEEKLGELGEGMMERYFAEGIFDAFEEMLDTFMAQAILSAMPAAQPVAVSCVNCGGHLGMFDESGAFGPAGIRMLCSNCAGWNLIVGDDLVLGRSDTSVSVEARAG